MITSMFNATDEACTFAVRMLLVFLLALLALDLEEIGSGPEEPLWY